MSQTYPSVLYKKIVSVQRNHFWFTARNAMIKSYVRRMIGNPIEKKTFLEIGCGTGIVMQLLERMGFVCTGLDVNEQALSYASGITIGKLVRQSIFRYKPDVKFHCVGSFDVLEHIKEDRTFLRICNRLLVPNGLLFLTVPAGMWLWSSVDEASGHVRRYELDDLVVKLHDSGFEVQSSMYWNVFLLPLYAIWHKHAGKHPKDVVSAHLRLMPPLVNTLLAWIMHAELMLSRLVRLPSGATLVICAQKFSNV